MTTYTESIETVVGGGPQVAPPALAEPPLADALRMPSRLANVIEEEIGDRQRAQPVGGQNLVGGTHITVVTETINHDAIGALDATDGNTMACGMGSGMEVTLEVEKDAEGHVVDARLVNNW